MLTQAVRMLARAVADNGVLRGLDSDSDFLRNTMVALCCPRIVADAYLGDTPREALYRAPSGSLTFGTALASLNKYTTTMHGINSAVIKLGKLTFSSKVYRGIAGMKLPPEFWQPNAFGVRGGVEQAFMSTTTEPSVAMGYAASGGLGFGIVIEVQQGMVNRCRRRRERRAPMPPTHACPNHSPLLLVQFSSKGC